MSKRKKKDKKKKRGTAEAAKRRAETHKTGYENTAFEIPEDKELFALKSEKSVKLDIIPYEVGEDNPYADPGTLHYERTYFVHRSIGVDETAYVCLSKTCGEKCPICEFRSKLAKDPDADEDLIKDLAPKERQLFNVIDTKNRSKGVQIWEISFHLFGKQLDREIRESDEDDKYEKFAELEDGFTLKLGIEEGHSGKASWFGVVSVNFKPRKEDYDEDILEETTCLDDILIIKDYDELKEIFLQTADEDDEKPKKKKSKEKKGKDEDEDEDDNNNGEDEENDVDVDEDDEDGDFDDEEDGEEEEEESKKKKSKKTAKKKKGKDKKNKKGSKKNKCPGGGTFGEDTDELPECEDCPKWDKCDAVE